MTLIPDIATTEEVVAPAVEPDDAPCPEPEAPFSAEDDRIPIFPDLFISGLTGVVVLLCVYSLLCIFAPATLGIRADTDIAPSAAGSRWLLSSLRPYLSRAPLWLGSLTPVLLFVLLAALPLIDRNPAREPRRRVVALTLGALVALVVIALGIAAGLE